MYTNEIARGLNHGTADSCTMTDFGDCFRIDLRWNNGGWSYSLFDEKSEAIHHAKRMGWAVNSTPDQIIDL